MLVSPHMPTAGRLLLQPGALVSGIYEICGLLGKGGMSEVYDALDTGLNRRVAIKIARTGVSRDAFLREGRIMAAFDDPSLVRIHAMGLHGDRPYLVMQRVVGKTLHEHLRVDGRTFSPRESCEILISLACTLDLLHQATLVHRDLKPGNIILAPANRVVLLDFGVSDMAQHISTERAVGSKHFMAPEVALGNQRPEHAHKADLYALGVIGFQLLTGRTPFPNGAIREVMSTQLAREAPRIEPYVPGIAPELADLIASLLAREPAARPESAQGVLHTLMGIVAAMRRTPERPRAREKRKVLLVEHTRPGWQRTRVQLQKQGYEVEVIEDEERVLSKFEETTFDLVVVSLPASEQRNHLMEAVKRRRPATKVMCLNRPGGRQEGTPLPTHAATRESRRRQSGRRLLSMDPSLGRPRSTQAG